MESPRSKPAQVTRSLLALSSERDSVPAPKHEECSTQQPQAFGVIDLPRPQPDVSAARFSKVASCITAWSFLPRRTLSVLMSKTLPTPSRQKLPYVKESLFQREFKIFMHYVRYVRAGKSGFGEISDDKRGLPDI